MKSQTSGSLTDILSIHFTVHLQCLINVSKCSGQMGFGPSQDTLIVLRQFINFLTATGPSCANKQWTKTMNMTFREKQVYYYVWQCKHFYWLNQN